MRTVHSRLEQVVRRPAEVRTLGRPWPGVRRIVLARHDRLGDVVLSLPAVLALRRAYPEAAVGLMVQPRFRPLGEMVDGVDRVLEASSDGEAVRRQLIEFRTDLLVCVSRGAAIPWAGVRAGVPRRVGPGYRWYTPMFHRSVDERRRHGGRHELEYALSFAHRCGAEGLPVGPLLRPPADAHRVAGDWLASRSMAAPFAVLHPGSGGSSPVWPVEHYARLAEMLRADGLGVVLSCGPQDDAVVAGFGAAGALGSAPTFREGLAATASLLSRAAVFIGNSTGPLHMAAALGTPSLGFYPPWASGGVARWGPYAPNGYGLVADDPGAASWPRRRRLREGPALMATVEPAVAARVARALVAGQRPGDCGICN